MRAAQIFGKDDLRLVDVEKPQAKENEIVVEIRACGVCPTDVRKLRTGAPGKELPFNPGHEWVGVVEQAGEGAGFSAGDAVAGLSFVGYSEYALVTGNELDRDMVIPLPREMPWDEATLFEPLADCLHSLVDRAGVKAGSTVAVLGAGTMGMLHMLAALNAGARVAVSEIDPYRIEKAREFGAHLVVDASKQDAVKETREFFDGNGADAVIVTVTLEELVNQGLEMAAQGGAVVLFGGSVAGTTVTIDPNIIHYNELNLTGSAGVGRPASRRNVGLFTRALEMLADGEIPGRKVITHRFDFEDVEEAIAMTERREGLKAVLVMRESK